MSDVERAARRYEPAAQAAILAAWTALRGQIPVGQIADAMRQGAEAVIQLLATAHLSEDALLAAVRPLVRAAQESALAAGRPFRIVFGLPDPRAASLVLSTADVNGWLQYNISQEARDLIRQTVRQAFLEGGHPYETARIIRGSIGMNPQQTASLLRFGDGLTAQGVTGTAWERAVARQEARYIQARAEMIARTETLRAAQQGQLEAWREARLQGLYEPERTFRVWIAVGDACDECAELDGMEVGLDEPWPTGDMEAQAHPSCRCTQGLAFHDPQ